MGASASKPARSAASTASRRQYPKQPSAASRAAAPRPQTETRQPQRQPQPPRSPPPPPTPQPREQASTVKSSVIDLDGRDPDFAASLRSIGPVTPNPTFSRTSAFNPRSAGAPTTQPGQQPVFPTATNPALLVLAARQKIATAAEAEVEEIGRPGFAGREFLDAFTIRQALTMRDRQGLSEGEIEGVLRLKKGVLERLGRKGVVGEVG
ncbi:uncharacterized protein ACLA_048030 [Aspergillus clavatus NRRL 1]|uniref:Helix-turn-helix domain-containing protein n=1 Tax=Aspergillus clavatus (strain ATCC 1007 / CBS 513.65 / DSM 816 / NCTC 3887 / NRRL 1 / QM 1276 / 107) TaxID=344612 RepID=A1CHH9_ASPCL|nr:uncharacterized protein ACLA_048030 [Aspergillus clavatus NRRL 1]EAW10334.1 conserved hypothetical protein [Aspergillus clavatus NRRL 1]